MDKISTQLEGIRDILYKESDQHEVKDIARTLVVSAPIPVIEYPLLRDENKLLKRGFDIVFSLFMIIFFLSWMLPLLAIFVKLTSWKGPVFFKQLRTGLDNKTFTCYKLRSLHVNTEAHEKQVIAGDERITPAGRVMRKFSLDELPQFYCVLVGNMSVVGPRPHMLNHTEQYAKMIDNYIVRHTVKPGITGMSQVKGYRGEIKSPCMLKNRVRYDLFYIEKWNFRLDLSIILKTCRLVLFGDRHAY